MKKTKILFLTFGLGILISLHSCKNEDNDDILIQEPQVTTTDISSIDSTSAISGGTIISNGGADIIEQGICWSTNQIPTINDSKITDASSLPLFACNLNSLEENTSYYVRAYAKNKSKIGYGNILQFSTDKSIKTLTLQPGSEGKDGYIDTNNPDYPGGETNNINALAWTNSGKEVYARSLIDFDLSQIPENSTIVSAYLSLYNNPISGNCNGKHSTDGSHDSLNGDDNGTYLRRITSSWEESTITWNNQPTTTSVAEVAIRPSTEAHEDFLDIDITPLIQEIINNKTTSYGMMLMLQTEEYYRSVIFSSSDHTDATKHPKLVVTYK